MVQLMVRSAHVHAQRSFARRIHVVVWRRTRLGSIAGSIRTGSRGLALSYAAALNSHGREGKLEKLHRNHTEDRAKGVPLLLLTVPFLATFLCVTHDPRSCVWVLILHTGIIASFHMSAERIVLQISVFQVHLNFPRIARPLRISSLCLFFVPLLVARLCQPQVRSVRRHQRHDPLPGLHHAHQSSTLLPYFSHPLLPTITGPCVCHVLYFRTHKL